MIINLFEVNYEDTTLCLNSTNKNIVIGGVNYYGAMAGFGEVNYDIKEVMGEVEFHVKFNRVSDYLKNYITDNRGTGHIELIIKQYDIDVGTETQIFTGVADVLALTDMAISINFKSLMTYLEECGTKLVTSPSCQTFLFSTRCGINKDYNMVTGTIDNIVNKIITATEFGTKIDTYFKFGYIICKNEYKLITWHIGTQIKVLTRFSSNIEIGDSFTAYSGCNKSFNACLNKYGNQYNFVGFPYVPLHEQLYIGQKTSQGDISTKK